jgi:hypothetical protein
VFRRSTAWASARLTHLGWALTLTQFLDPERLTTYPGRPFGLDLAVAERRALVDELARWLRRASWQLALRRNLWLTLSRFIIFRLIRGADPA